MLLPEAGEVWGSLCRLLAEEEHEWLHDTGVNKMEPDSIRTWRLMLQAGFEAGGVAFRAT